MKKLMLSMVVAILGIGILRLGHALAQKPSMDPQKQLEQQKKLRDLSKVQRTVCNVRRVFPLQSLSQAGGDLVFETLKYNSTYTRLDFVISNLRGDPWSGVATIYILRKKRGTDLASSVIVSWEGAGWVS